MLLSHDKKRENVSSEVIIENEQFGNVILEAEERQREIGCENEQKWRENASEEWIFGS